MRKPGKHTYRLLCLFLALFGLMSGAALSGNFGLFFALPALTLAAPGDLDSTFGNGGIVITPITDAPNLFEFPHSIQAQPDGKIVVCGVVNYIEGGFGGPVSTILARYNPNGTLDASFGAGGKVVFSGNSHVGFNMALQPDGKIIAVGHTITGNLSFAVYRFNPDGTPDVSFGAGGAVFPQVVGGANDVVVQPDGKIIIVGIGNAHTPNYPDFAVVRLNPNGSPDNSFGAGGIVITEIRTGIVSDEPGSVALQPDGKIVVLGTSVTIGSPNPLIALVRYNPNGSLDLGFGESGKIFQSLRNVPVFLDVPLVHDVALQPDGKIVIARQGLGIVRCNPDGSVDRSFAANGIFSPMSGSFGVTGIALQPDGKIVAFGGGRIGESWGFAVTRLNSNGSPDVGFGANGRIITPIGKDGSYAAAGAIQPDGKILAFGLTRAPEGNHLALVRYLAGSLVGVSAASFSGTELAADSIVAGFGAELATETVSASGTPLPTSLAGTTVNVRDSAGMERIAPLFFVSPTQVNYLMPPGTAVGTATVTVTSGSGKVSVGASRIDTVAPGLFVANANGQGVAAAVALRVKADGSRSYEPIALFDAAQNKFITRPLDLGPSGEQVYLLLFGTGIRHRSSLTSVIATIGGAYADVSFAGAQPDFVGVDQVNVLVPRSLAGRGEVEVHLIVEGRGANNVRIRIK